MRMLLVDDHALFRDGLKFVLNDLDGDVEILEAGNCNDAFAILEEDDDFDLILLDLDLPGMSGLEGLQKIRVMTPVIPVVILSGSEDGNLVRRGLELGVMGYIPKSLSSDIMLQALQLVMKGGRYVPDNILLSAPEKNKRSLQSLTSRQLEILRHITMGKSNKEIARALGIADNTVRVHISAIFQVLNVNNRTEAAYAAMQEGLIESSN
ncbi:response regulator [Emcibacter nanhaiensis]|uniref:Response regulator transcription factor n=1 Tax=Emcibacter nanhaiensis TaxID=1505037 RepID=A0A501PQQ5_9PROT|nr:response regulator transcription factor [Emcibacter nanhaiensis]TPD62575.1 response regulator transcription factor [Emcibacter nanhaiensis]